jgi:calcineurin-like phosphoesterase family protein
VAVFFTSDLHFGHANVIKYCNRPFATASEMNEALIANWNSVVGPNDTIYILGDVFFCQPSEAVEILSRLNGKKHLVYGNHDKQIKSNRQVQQFFEVIHPDLYEKKIDEHFVTMCHYPMMSWNKSFHGSFQLHGHIHGKTPFTGQMRRYDVGVDANNYTPVKWETIRDALLTIPLGRGADI